jgi:predicted Zn-dependent protease
LADWDAVVATASGDDRTSFRINRATALAQAGVHAEAMKELTDLEKDKSSSGERLDSLACVAALAMTAVERDKALSVTERDLLAGQYGQRAVVLLERAWQAGLFKDAEMRDHLKKDGDLAALRNRGDFKHLLAQVEKKPGGD